MKIIASKKRALALLMSVMTMFFSLSPLSATAQADIDDEVLSGLESGIHVTSKTYNKVAHGVSELNVTTNNSDGTNQNDCYALEVNINDPDTGILASYKNYSFDSLGMQSVRDQAACAEAFYQKTNPDFNVVAGVNGDFFNMGNGAPTGTFVMAGSICNVNKGWPYFAIKKDGTPVIGRTATEAEIAEFQECVGGPGVIVEDGKLTEESRTMGYGVVTNPRTAVGIKADGSIVLLVVDGRQSPYSKGMTFVELADTMIAMGCVDALSIDGGGSSTFISQHEGSEELVCRNSPSDGTERTVSSALLVYSTVKQSGEFNHASISPNNEIYAPGATVTFTAKGIDSAGYSAALPDGGYLALGDDAYGTMTDGVFTSNGTPGEVNVNYIVDGDVCGTTSITIQNVNDMELLVGDEPQSNRWYIAGTNIYYFGSDGVPITGENVIDGKTYTFDDCGILTKGLLIYEKSGGGYFYYLPGFNSDKGVWELVRQRAWIMIDGEWHFFDRKTGPSFRMAVGKYTVEKGTEGQKTYVFSSKGVLTKGAWYYTDMGTSYYWGPAAVTGWQTVDNSVYYFNPATSYAVSGWKYIDGSVYYFNPSNNKMVTGNQNIDGKDYTFADDGKCATPSVSVEISGLFYSFNSEGELMTNHINNHPYNPVTDNAIAPTVFETGLTAGEHCGVCNQVIIPQAVVEKLPETTTAEQTTAPEITEPTTIPEEKTTEPTTAPVIETTTVMIEETTTHVEAESTTVPDTTPITEPSSESEIDSEPVNFMLGDVNSDGKVNAADARLALRISADLDVATEIQLLAADVDGNKKITASDARTILRVSADLEKF